jgi:hypothetical protein
MDTVQPENIVVAPVTVNIKVNYTKKIGMPENLQESKGLP